MIYFWQNSASQLRIMLEYGSFFFFFSDSVHDILENICVFCTL